MSSGRLYNHVLQCIYAYATLHEMYAAARTCRLWWNAAIQPQRRTDSVTLFHNRPAIATLISLWKSPWSQFVVRIIAHQWSRRLCDAAALFPAVHTLDVILGVFHGRMVLFPHALTELRCDLTSPTDSYNQLDPLKAALAQQPVLKRLVLVASTNRYARSWDNPWPFARWIHLEELTSDHNVMQLSDEELIALGTLQTLRRLNITRYAWTIGRLQQLFHCRRSRLQSIDFSVTFFTEEHVRLLHDLVHETLDTLNPGRISHAALSCVTHLLPQLQFLFIRRAADDEERSEQIRPDSMWNRERTVFAPTDWDAAFHGVSVILRLEIDFMNFCSADGARFCAQRDPACTIYTNCQR